MSHYTDHRDTATLRLKRIRKGRHSNPYSTLFDSIQCTSFYKHGNNAFSSNKHSCQKKWKTNAFILSLNIALLTPHRVSGTVQSVVSKTREALSSGGSQSPQLQRSKKSNKYPFTHWPELSNVYTVIASDPQERREGRKERKMSNKVKCLYTSAKSQSPPHTDKLVRRFSIFTF